MAAEDGFYCIVYLHFELNKGYDTIVLGSAVAQWYIVFDSRLRGPGFEPHLPNCVAVLEQDIFILA